MVTRSTGLKALVAHKNKWDCESQEEFMTDELRDVTPGFIGEQTAIDFSGLRNPFHCFPCNLDGLTERAGHFLVFELKHGEELSGGQFRMLKALAALPQFTVMVIQCRKTPVSEKNARNFHPQTFEVMAADGTLGDTHLTTVEDMAARYYVWLRNADDGHRPFTCSVAEFQKIYLPRLPECERARALSGIQTAPGWENV
jgi:hypothetical protein